MQRTKQWRYCDSTIGKSCDPSEIAHAISLFAKSIMTLFIDEMALKCGMTATMLEHLRKPHTILINGGKLVKTIGCATGVPADLINRCMHGCNVGHD